MRAFAIGIAFALTLGLATTPVPAGWGRLWGKDNARFMKSNPGIGVAAAEWLAKQDPMLVGGDTPPIEVSPNPDPQISLPVHHAGDQRHSPAGEPEAGRAGGEEGLRVGVRDAAPQAHGFTGSTVAPTAFR
jgi:hypothetical protein